MTGSAVVASDLADDAEESPLPTGLERVTRLLVGGDALPAWYSNILYAALIWCVTAGVTALVTLTKTKYSPLLCTIVATAVTAATWPFRPRAPKTESRAHGPAVAAFAIALALLAVAGHFHSEHILTDRDPAVYINTGRSIARNHRVRPILPASPFDNRNYFATHVAGFQVSDHQVFSSFLNFLPVLLALGWSAGGDTGLLLVPAILGALGMLALYALASTVVGPRWALLGPALLTLAPMQAWFARDAYAELPLELLALGGLWLYIAARRNGGIVAGVVAGFVIGAMTMVRIDALAILVALPPALTVEYLRASALEPAACRRRRQAIGSFAATVIVTGYAGLRVSHRLTPGYVTELQHNLHLLELACAAGVFAAIAIAVLHRIRRGLGQHLARNDLVLWIAGALTVAVSVYAYKFRPRGGVPPVIASPTMTAAARKTLDAFLFTASFRWFAWYLGTITLVLVVVGFIVLGVRATRTDSPAFILLAAALPVTVLYIARPSVSPDQLWAMRRYLPVVLPAMTIAVGAAAMWSTSRIGRWRSYLRAPAVIAVVAATLVPAAASGRPLARAQMQGGALAAVQEICRITGPDAAIAVEPLHLLAVELPQTLRGFCGVEASGIKDNIAIPKPVLERFKAFHKKVYIASAFPLEGLHLEAGAVLVAHLVVADAHEPERALGRKARTYSPRPVEVFLYRIATD
jgi:Dolichyl-phosphate-mannose-protein mannosyltransferase